MINSIKDLAYVNEDGTYILPAGPCMAWPKERGQPGPGLSEGGVASDKYAPVPVTDGVTKKIKASWSDMAKGAIQGGIQLVQTGKASKEDRDARMDECLKCDHFIVESKRCSECGCFMEAKTWISAANCPIGKW